MSMYYAVNNCITLWRSGDSQCLAFGKGRRGSRRDDVMEETEIMCAVYMKLHHPHHHELHYDPPTTPS